MRTMAKQSYTITVGEVGNNIGHVNVSYHVSDKAAVRAARRTARAYGKDGWLMVADAFGNLVG